jgi:Protein-L-isoaspartate(D-aspartate) O-methyltransferase (PCMT)
MKTPLSMEFEKLREEMVEKAIFARGVRSELVLNAMRSVAPELFLPAQLREFAYDDAPLPIEEGQTISQPYIVAFNGKRFVSSGMAQGGGGRSAARQSAPYGSPATGPKSFGGLRFFVAAS